MAEIPPQLLKAMAARKTGENMHPPAKSKKKSANISSMVGNKPTMKGSMNPAEGAKMKGNPFAAAAQRKLGK